MSVSTDGLVSADFQNNNAELFEEGSVGITDTTIDSLNGLVVLALRLLLHTVVMQCCTVCTRIRYFCVPGYSFGMLGLKSRQSPLMVCGAIVVLTCPVVLRH